MKINLTSEIILAMILLNLAIASASYSLGNFSIDRTYASGENIRGWVNMSFQNEAIDSIISSSMPGTIKLVDFLRNNSASYSCSPIPDDCGMRYASSSPEVKKNFSLEYGEEKTLGLVLRGRIAQSSDITSANFDIIASSPPSCINPLKLDILDNGDVDFSSAKVLDSFTCLTDGYRGCFDSTSSLEEVYLGRTPFCEKISLTASERFRLIAWLKNDSTSSNLNDNIKMMLYDSDGNFKKECYLPEPSTAGGEVYCDVNFSNSNVKDYYVCVKAANQQTTKYKARRENVNPCGFNANPPSTNYEYDYDISAKAAIFDSVGKMKINGTSLLNNIRTYVSSKYKNNCTPECVIPIKFTSYANLNIEVSNVSLKYLSGGGVEENNIYETSKQNSTINADFAILDLEEANFSVRGSNGNTTFYFKLNNQDVFSRVITIGNVPVITSISPLSVPAAASTKFIAFVTVPGSRNITKYSWDFGDETSEDTTINNVYHSYSSIGSYTITLTITDNTGFTVSKSFTIEAVSPKELVNSTIKDYKQRLSNLTSQIASMPAWYKTKVSRKLMIEDLQDGLDTLERDYLASFSDEEYISLMGNLTALEIPYSITEANTTSLSFFINPDNLDLAGLRELGAGDFEVTDAEKEAVTSWTQENLNMRMEFKYISAYYNDKVENIYGVYKIKITPEESENKLFFLINKKVDFENSALKTKEIGEGYGIEFSAIPNEISFLSESTLDDLAISMSPSSSLLEVPEIEPCNSNGICEKDLGEDWKNCRQDCKPWPWIIFWLVLVFIFAIAAYIFLQWWYTVKYENYLFKNRNDIFNLVTSIKNARAQGMTDGDIRSRLKSAGWTGEQVSYIFKKVDNKAIMPFAFLNFFKGKENRYPVQQGF